MVAASAVGGWAPVGGGDHLLVVAFLRIGRHAAADSRDDSRWGNLATMKGEGES